MIVTLINILVPPLAAVLVGVVWARRGRPFELAQVTPLVINVASPCLVFSALTTSGVPPAELIEVGLAAVAVYAGVAVVAMAGLRWAGLPFHTYLPPLLFPNTGNMGLPLCLFAFGEPGLALGVGYLTVAVVGQNTVGQVIAAGAWHPGPVLRTPIIHAAWLAALFVGLDWPVPVWLAQSTALIGDLAIPLVLILLGITLGRTPVVRPGRTTVMSAARIGLGTGVGAAVAAVFGLTGTAAGVVILQSAMPVAVFNYLWAAHYHRAPEEIAGQVVVSTVLSFATLPLLLAWLL